MFTLFSGRIQHGGSLFAQIISTNIWSLGELRDLNSEINQNKLNWPNYTKLQKRRQYTRSTKIQRNVQGVRNIVNYGIKGTLQVRCPKGECWAGTCQNADMACDCWLLHAVNTKSFINIQATISAFWLVKKMSINPKSVQQGWLLSAHARKSKKLFRFCTLCECIARTRGFRCC